MTICVCTSCFPEFPSMDNAKTYQCSAQKQTTQLHETTPTLLNDLPDDLLLHVRSILKRMVKQEAPYTIPPPYSFVEKKQGFYQWRWQKAAIAMTSKKGILEWDKRQHMYHREIWRCEECFAETAETTLCNKCFERIEAEEEYYFKAPLSVLLNK